MREKQEETIIMNTILLHMKGLRMLMTYNAPIRLNPFTSGYRETVKKWSKLRKNGLGTRMCA